MYIYALVQVGQVQAREGEVIAYKYGKGPFVRLRHYDL